VVREVILKPIAGAQLLIRLPLLLPTIATLAHHAHGCGCPACPHAPAVISARSTNDDQGKRFADKTTRTAGETFETGSAAVEESTRGVEQTSRFINFLNVKCCELDSSPPCALTCR
jgi:hypothetical protein